MFYGNQFVGSFDCDGKRLTRIRKITLKIKIAAKRVISSVALISIVGWSMMAGWALPRLVEAFNAPQVFAQTVTINHETLPPVLSRIAKCESSTGQYAKDGQVARHVNSDGSYDTGEFMINSVHNKEASKMGYDLSKESDNKAYAVWLYANRGTGDWYSSAHCWNK